MSGLISGVGYSTGSYFAQIVGWVSPAVDGIESLLTNPYFLGIILVLVALSLIPGTDN